MLSRAPPSANPMQHLEVRVVQQNGPKGDGRDRGLGHVINGKPGEVQSRRVRQSLGGRLPRGIGLVPADFLSQLRSLHLQPHNLMAVHSQSLSSTN